MSSKKLRKYLAYYRKTLRDDPENIEARLRLAALFREMGRISHAIEEYGMAAKLLASEGLPLEAIAACKAIFELDPSHQETQFFLAKLYARVPEATGDSVRIARPLVEKPGPATGEVDTHGWERENSRPRVQGLSERQAQRVMNKEEPAITLNSPKFNRREVPPASEEPPESIEADVADAITSPLSAEKIPVFDGGMPQREEITRTARPSALAMEEAARAMEQEAAEDTGLMEKTVTHSIEDSASLRETVGHEDRQTFDLGVFDLDSLGLDENSAERWDDLPILDELDEPDTTEIATTDDDGGTNGGSPLRMQRQFRISALPQIPLFSQLPRKVFLDVLNAMELQELAAGTEVLRPDDPATCLYVVVHGWVKVEKDLIDGRTVELARMGEGEVFGEFRLLTGKGGMAKVVAETDVELLAIQDEVVYEIGREHPGIWDVLWGFYYERILNHSMAASELFGGLNIEERELVAQHFELGELPAGDLLFGRGEEVDLIILVASGSVQVEIPGGEEPHIVEVLEEGSFLGVSPCALEVPATATAKARTDLVYMTMPGSIFREVMYGLPEVAEAVRRVVRRRQARTGGHIDDSSLLKLF